MPIGVEGQRDRPLLRLILAPFERRQPGRDRSSGLQGRLP
jgi:hypothetical protein